MTSSDMRWLRATFGRVRLSSKPKCACVSLEDDFHERLLCVFGVSLRLCQGEVQSVVCSKLRCRDLQCVICLPRGGCMFNTVLKVLGVHVFVLFA